MRVHAKAKGIEPISGLRYSAINPEAQRWVHITGWQSVLKCYERYGPGRFRMSRNPGSGLSRGSRRSYRPASPPMSRRRETRSARISPTFAASCAPPSTPTGRCAMCSGRLATAARGCGRAAGCWRPRRSRRCRKWVRRTGNFDQQAAVDAAVARVAQAMVRPLSAGNSRPLLPWRGGWFRRPPRCWPST
jgi:hypothetical protein